ncbi:MAG TPA: OsmC family protein [Acidimicrobiales bacterium]|nr:OsmC family protein [Acidimicrobiales bacterium]
MPTRTAEAQWDGLLKDGSGTMRFGSGVFEGAYTFDSRFVDEGGATNPEELIAAAAAGCFSMALSADLGNAGHDVRRVHTTAEVHLEKTGGGFSITGIDLRTEAEVPGLGDDAFQEVADGTRRNCPVARLLTGAPIRLDAKLL